MYPALPSPSAHSSVLFVPFSLLTFIVLPACEVCLTYFSLRIPFCPLTDLWSRLTRKWNCEIPPSVFGDCVVLQVTTAGKQV